MLIEPKSIGSNLRCVATWISSFMSHKSKATKTTKTVDGFKLYCKKASSIQSASQTVALTYSNCQEHSHHSSQKQQQHKQRSLTFDHSSGCAFLYYARSEYLY
eukprot:TRINITY_DN88750_c0_g1_i1.p1 TRINITY_DN88750_c0_g1~~TRINITY_DN88750_c0_g1_i1.p1  ORF type:complete len:103 (-),score=1.86 TRINITY_DN88750_c0_g1_i1:3-311(-)